MKNNIWFISDLHLGHDKVLTFKNDDDTMLREFNSIEEMNGTIVANWNRVVKDNDRVYVLGDVAWGGENLRWLKAMKGKKTLVMGNHDNLWNVRKFLDVFDDICGAKSLNLSGLKIILTHIPIHKDSLARWDVNIHGHLHSNLVKEEWHGNDGSIEELNDPYYLNVSVEQINYTPISIEQVGYCMEQR